MTAWPIRSPHQSTLLDGSNGPETASPFVFSTPLTSSKRFGRKRYKKLKKLLKKLIQQTEKVPKSTAARLAEETIDQWLSGVQRPIDKSLELSALGIYPSESKIEVSERLNTSISLDDNFQSQKMLALQNLAFGASHEINNPLANIATRAQSLIAQENDPSNLSPDPERRIKLAVIYEQAMRAHEMISDLMLFANPPDIDRQNLDLRIWLAGLIKQINQLIHTPAELLFGQGNAKVTSFGAQNQIDFRAILGPGLETISADPTQLAVAIKAMVRNSVESIRSRSDCGTIELRVSRNQSTHLLFTVTDNGPGIPDTIRDFIFDPFFSGREAGRGLGFGLSKAWRIAELHGGKLKLNPTVAKGTQFELSLPFSSVQPKSNPLNLTH